MKARVSFIFTSVNFTDYSVAVGWTPGDAEERSGERACAGDRRPGGGPGPAGRWGAGLLLDRSVRCVPSYRRETTVLSTFGSPAPRWPPRICARSPTALHRCQGGVICARIGGQVPSERLRCVAVMCIPVSGCESLRQEPVGGK